MQNGTLSSKEKSQNWSKMERQTTSMFRKMSAELLDTAEETIIDFISCPYCNDYVEPPSICCENGHFMCGGCKNQVTNCPCCGTDSYPNKSNSTFDMILKEIYYPCYYQENGCVAYFKYTELKEHKLVCEYKLNACAFKSGGCSLLLKTNEKESHEAKCIYGVYCRVYSKRKGQVTIDCNWKGMIQELPLHVANCHKSAWSPREIESNVMLSWMLPMNYDFEITELIHLKDVGEMFYFYSKGIENFQHYICVQYVGHKETWKEYMYSVEFVYESKKVKFEDVVIPYDVKGDDIYKSSNCFSINYGFLKKHFLAERVIDCYIKVFHKEQRKTEVKRYITYLDNVIKEE